VSDILVAFVIFCLLAGAALAALLSHHRLPPQFRSDETANVVAKVAGLFVVTTSLLLGLMLNSARTTFETTDRNIHALATSLIILDRTLRRYGPEMAETRRI
jgi:ABC-type sulfate transport system permease component